MVQRLSLSIASDTQGERTLESGQCVATKDRLMKTKSCALRARQKAGRRRPSSLPKSRFRKQRKN